MVRYHVRENVDQYLSELMEAESTYYIGQEQYQRRGEDKVNHRNCGYKQRFTLKGIGEVAANA